MSSNVTQQSRADELLAKKNQDAEKRALELAKAALAPHMEKIIPSYDPCGQSEDAAIQKSASAILALQGTSIDRALQLNLGLAEMTCEQLRARLDQASEHILRLEAELAEVRRNAADVVTPSKDDCVTLESAMQAIEHVFIDNKPRRKEEAVGMLSVFNFSSLSNQEDTSLIRGPLTARQRMDAYALISNFRHLGREGDDHVIRGIAVMGYVNGVIDMRETHGEENA